MTDEPTRPVPNTEHPTVEGSADETTEAADTPSPHRPRTSTVVLVVAFLAVLALYLVVRPEPTVRVPVDRVPSQEQTRDEPRPSDEPTSTPTRESSPTPTQEPGEEQTGDPGDEPSQEPTRDPTPDPTEPTPTTPQPTSPAPTGTPTGDPSPTGNAASPDSPQD